VAMQQYNLSPFQMKFIMNNNLLDYRSYNMKICLVLTKIVNNVCFPCANASVSGRPQVAMQQ